MLKLRLVDADCGIEADVEFNDGGEDKNKDDNVECDDGDVDETSFDELEIDKNDDECDESGDKREVALVSELKNVEDVGVDNGKDDDGKNNDDKGLDEALVESGAE